MAIILIRGALINFYLKRHFSHSLYDFLDYNKKIIGYSLEYKNGLYKFVNISDSIKKSIKTKYKISLVEVDTPLTRSTLSYDSNKKIIKTNKKIKIGDSVFKINKIIVDRGGYQLYSPNIGVVAFLWNRKRTKTFEKILGDKLKRDYTDFPSLLPYQTLGLYIPSKYSKDKIWYDNSVFEYNKNNFYLRDTPAARWWK